MSAREQDALNRALQLAFTGNTDAEIVCVLEAETGRPAVEIAAAIGREDLAEQFASDSVTDRLERRRVAGKAAFRDYGVRASIPETPTAGSMTLYQWNSRQMLGYTTQGVSGEVKDAAEKLDGMTDEQLADHFESQARALRGKSADA